MKFKVTLRNKLNGSIETKIVEADTEVDASYEAEEPNTQILSVRPLRQIGEKPEKPVKSTYVSIKVLRARKERDLCNQQMHLGKYSPEAIQAREAKEQEQLRKEMQAELDKMTDWSGNSDGSVGVD